MLANIYSCLVQVENYNIEAKDRLSHDLQWVDTSLKAEIQRINVNLDTQFLGNLMMRLIITWKVFS